MKRMHALTHVTSVSVTLPYNVPVTLPYNVPLTLPYNDCSCPNKETGKNKVIGNRM